MHGSPFSQRRLTVRLWTLVALGLLTSIAIAAYVAWSLASIGDENAASRGAQERAQLTLEQLRRLASESHAITLSLLSEPNSAEPSATNAAQDAFESMVRRATDDASIPLRSDQLMLQLVAMRGIWERALQWRRDFAAVASDVAEEKSIGEARERLHDLQAAINGLEGERNLHLARLLRRWKSSDGEAFITLARQIREEQALRWPRAVQEAMIETSELGRTVELLAAQQQLSAIADIKDNRIKPSVDRLAQRLALLDAGSSATALDLKSKLRAVVSALFGQDFNFDAAHQTVVIGTSGLFRLQQTLVEMTEVRQGLILEAGRQLATSHQALDSLALSAAAQIVAGNEQAGARLGTALVRIALSVGVLAVIFLWLGVVTSGHIRRQFEELAAMQQQNALILNSVSEGVIGLGANGEMRFVNPVAAQLLGASADSMVDGPLTRFWLTADGDASPLDQPGMLANGIVNGHCRLRRPDGSMITVEYSALPMKGDGDDAYKGAVITFRDISAAQAVKAALLESEGKFRDLSEKSLVGIYIIQNGLFTYVNPQFAKVFGYTREEIEGRLGPRQLSHPDDFDQVSRNIEKRLSGAIDSIDYSIRCLRKDGELIHVDLLGSRTQFGGEPAIIGTLVDTTARTLAEARVKYQAYHDALTDLPNRLLCNDRLEHALTKAGRLNQYVAVLFLDLDRFKLINDSLGHPVGDALLVSAAQRLKNTVRQGDTVARLGGDEFVVILESLDEQRAPAAVAGKILNALAEPITLAGQELTVTCSIGIAIYPDDGEDADTLIKNADAAMYQAKRSGRSTCAFYSPELTLTSTRWLDLESALRKAIARQELELAYQPLIDLSNGRLVGAEVLLRWRHPEKGLISPADFIPLAEETGLIVEIGDWVLGQACAQLRDWRLRGLRLPRLAINVSSVQISRGGILESVKRVLETYEVDPARLELEITENAIMEHTEKSRRMLQALRAQGVSVAIDDFGTGYSSLAYLQKLPIDKLKVDQSFIAGIPDERGSEAIVKAIIALGRLLELEIVAEGVERVEQHRFVLENGCHVAQGYLYSRPGPAAALEAMLREDATPVSGWPM